MSNAPFCYAIDRTVQIKNVCLTFSTSLVGNFHSNPTLSPVETVTEQFSVASSPSAKLYAFVASMYGFEISLSEAENEHFYKSRK